MKKVLMLLALSSISVSAFAHAAPAKHSEQMQAQLAQIDSITIYRGDNVDSKKQAYKTVNTAIQPNFEKCAVYLPKGASKASTTVTLSRDADGKMTLGCSYNQ